MSTWLPETPDLSRRYCPGCEGDADPMAEILTIVYCDAHAPDLRGSADQIASPLGPSLLGSGSAEAGEDGPAWCRAIHGPAAETARLLQAVRDNQAEITRVATERDVLAAAARRPCRGGTEGGD